MKPALGPETRLHVSSSVYSRPFGKEIVLLDFGRGEYFALDEIGAEIWDRLSRGESLSVIATQIASEFEVSEERALADIVDIVTQLCTNALVHPTSASDASVVT